MTTPDTNKGIEPAIGTSSDPLHDQTQRQGGSDDDDQAVGPDLGQHDFRRRQRHDQQMLDGAVLALADQRRAGQERWRAW